MQYCSLTSGRFANCTLNCSSSLVTNKASVFRIPLVRKLGFFLAFSPLTVPRRGSSPGYCVLELRWNRTCFIMALRRERNDLGCAETVLQEQDGHPGMEEREDRDGEWIWSKGKRLAYLSHCPEKAQPPFDIWYSVWYSMKVHLTWRISFPEWIKSRVVSCFKKNPSIKIQQHLKDQMASQIK